MSIKEAEFLLGKVGDLDAKVDALDENEQNQNKALKLISEAKSLRK